jgi:uncharacterized membrane protein YdbT with pleckstrin-like domain
MNEIPQILDAKEKIIWDGKPKYAPYMISVILGAIIAAVFCLFITGIFGIIIGPIVGFIILLIGSLAYKFTHYALTTRRVIIQTGIFGRNFKSVNYDDIKNASVTKGFFNWIFGTGTIQIFTGELTSTGGKHPRTVSKYDNFVYISNPYDALKELQEHLTRMEEDLYGGKNVVQKVRVIK